MTEHRAQQLVQAGERKLRLRLDPGGPQHPQAGGVLGRVVEQGRLADAGLAAEHERRAGAGTGIVEQGADPRPFRLPAHQHADDPTC